MDSNICTTRIHSNRQAESRQSTTSQVLRKKVYPRPSGEVYLCGEPETLNVPQDGEVEVVESKCDMIVQGTSQVSSLLQSAEILKQQACFLPIPPQGIPLIGAVPGCEGAYVATGHSCWGILNAPATGLAMSQLIVDGKCSLLDLTPFEPRTQSLQHSFAM
eukprot:TRINITY_DN6893_c0_g1_i6.p4 TRINITY_DN6893_c0_g1~~TRINITY_DN6893_c0_g1_i6.p4  ORF type:complete len:161 (+),score=13.41 TRINITY_DN6893_c0_g1_i6:396-878(+)